MAAGDGAGDVQADLRHHSLRGHRGIAGDDDHPDAGLLCLRQRIGYFRARRVDHAGNAEKGQAVFDIFFRDGAVLRQHLAGKCQCAQAVLREVFISVFYGAALFIAHIFVIAVF